VFLAKNKLKEVYSVALSSTLYMLYQVCPILLLEGHCPAEFSSNPN